MLGRKTLVPTRVLVPKTCQIKGSHPETPNTPHSKHVQCELPRRGVGTNSNDMRTLGW